MTIMSQYQLAIQTCTVPSANVWSTTENAGEGRDAQLLERFIAGDDAAFVELFDAHNHRLYLYCVNIVKDAQAAEDITQEMWERVLRLRVEPKAIRNPAGFFVTIARNLSLNHVRDRRKLDALDGEHEHLASPHRERTAEEEMVRHALDRLSFDYREVLILSVYSDYSFEEIAGMLGTTRLAVWKRASRARARLGALVVEMLEAEQRRAALPATALTRSRSHD